MTRLTKTIREDMTNDLLRHRFEAAGKQLGEKSSVLFRMVYDDLYDEEDQKLIARLMKKHRTGFAFQWSIRCNVNGMSLEVGRARLITRRDIIAMPETEPLPMLENDRQGRSTYSDCKIGRALAEFADERLALGKQVETAFSEIMGALSGVTTAKQLAELWPEALPIVGRRIPVPCGSNLPAVQFSKLTQALNLEPAGAAE